MEIATRESRLLMTIDYKDGCRKKINILKYYDGDEKTPNFRWMTVEYINPDGTIDEKKSNSYRENMDESDTEYEDLRILLKKRTIKILTTIYYYDGCEKTIKIEQMYSNFYLLPDYNYNSAEFKYPDGKIDEKRSKYSKQYINKIGEYDFRYEKCFRFAYPDVRKKNI